MKRLPDISKRYHYIANELIGTIPTDDMNIGLQGHYEELKKAIQKFSDVYHEEMFRREKTIPDTEDE